MKINLLNVNFLSTFVVFIKNVLKRLLNRFFLYLCSAFLRPVVSVMGN